jgi:hypothetical protein
MSRSGSRPERYPFSPGVLPLLEYGHSAATVARKKGVTRQLISLQVSGQRRMQQSTLDVIAELTTKAVAKSVRTRAAISFRQRHPDCTADQIYVDDTKVGAS